MGKPGAKPQGKVKIEWSAEFAYAIGLLATDGNLSGNKRHISLISNDLEQIKNFKQCLKLKNKIGRHISGTTRKRGFRIQFGDVLFYNFLLKIGLTPKKSLTIGALDIPKKYYFDFLRGHFDGDGTFWSYWDKRWRSSYMFYVYFYSASQKHILWLQARNYRYLKLKGHMTKSLRDSTYSLRYAKRESEILIKAIYQSRPYLSRKYLKIKEALGIIGKSV